MKLGLDAGVVDGVRRRLRKRRHGRERGENGLKVVLKEVIVRTGMDIIAVFASRLRVCCVCVCVLCTLYSVCIRSFWFEC